MGQEEIELGVLPIPGLVAIIELLLRMIDDPIEMQRDFIGFTMAESGRVPQSSRKRFMAMTAIEAVFSAYALGNPDLQESGETFMPRVEPTIRFLALVMKDAYPTLHKYLEDVE